MIIRALISFGLASIFLSSCNSINTDTSSGEAEREVEVGVIVPQQRGAVNDFEDILNDEHENELKSSIYAFRQTTGNRIVLVTIDTIPADETPTVFAASIGNKWDIGEGQKNNGLILLVSEGVSQVGIATGQELETIYNDSICDNVIRSIIPYLSVGDYFGGISKAITMLQEVTHPSKID